MRRNRHTSRGLTKRRHPLPVASKPTNKLLNPPQRIPLIIQRQIRIPGLRRVQVAQRAETVLDARADDGRVVQDGLLDHERGAVLLVDFAENEAAAVDVDENGEVGRVRGLERGEGDVELQD